MYTSVEIEYKTKINKEDYLKLIEKFNLKDLIFTQTNYYFDTPTHSLINNDIVLRIREKAHNIKLTSKTPQQEGLLERHIILTKEEAYKMIENGFNANIIEINKDVKLVASLTTHRCKMNYKSGTLFFDMNTYYDETDYEIEFESEDSELGQKEFLEFLEENNLKFIKMPSKSSRAYKKSSLKK